jgi:hypothetical protein
MTVSPNSSPISIHRFRAWFILLVLCIIFFLVGALIPFFTTGTYHYTSNDILARDTLEYLPPFWLSPFGWLIFLLMRLSPGLFPLLAIATGILLRSCWIHMRQREKLIWTSVLIVSISMAIAIWSPTDVAMRMWVLT